MKGSAFMYHNKKTDVHKPVNLLSEMLQGPGKNEPRSAAWCIMISHSMVADHYDSES